jgi:hypothetical protein
VDKADAALARYFRDIHKVRRVPREELPQKLTLAREGTDTARRVREEVLEGCLEVAALLALHVAPPWMSDLDAVQEANLTIMKLIDDSSVPSPVAALTPALLKRFGEMEPERPIFQEGGKEAHQAGKTERRADSSWLQRRYRRIKFRASHSRVVCTVGGHKPTERVAEITFSDSGPPRPIRVRLRCRCGRSEVPLWDQDSGGTIP